MKNATSHLFVLLCLCSTAPHLLASSTELSVRGTITPNACNVRLSDNGLVDHGRIQARSLNQYEFSPLPTRPLDLKVSCNQAVLFVLVGIDNRESSSLGPGFYYGLGNNIHAPDERLGTISLRISNVMADGAPALVLASSNQGQTWFPEATAYPNNFMGFARPGTLIPEPHQFLDAALQINTSINAAAVLSLDQEVPLDGSIALDLRYM